MMARRRKAEPATPNARALALTIRQGERAGLTQKQIGATLGINERTVRKIKAGETSGNRTYGRITRSPEKMLTRNAYNASFTIGYTASGDAIVGSTNVRIPQLQTARGTMRAPTPLDVFDPRIRRKLGAVVSEQRKALARRYAQIAVTAPSSDAVRLRSIQHARRRVHDLTTGA